MNKFDYFRLSFDYEAYRAKAWVISAFSLTITPPNAPMKQRVYPSETERNIDSLCLKRDPFGKAFFHDPESGEVVWLEDIPENVAGFSFSEPVSLKSGTCANLDRDVSTTYGAWLFNQIIVVYPFGSKIAFSPNGYTIGEIERIIEARLADDPVGDAPAVSGPSTSAPIYVREYIKYNEAAGALTGYTQLCVPAATPFTMTVDPAVIKRRDELFEMYKDQLDDPVIQAKIGDELIRLDKDWIAKDPDGGFYYRNKSFDVVRKSLFMFQGSDSGLGRTGQFIKTSLDEGMDPETLPDLANSQRNASFSRGAQTALGGVTTKFNLRMFQNAQVVPGDCGTKIGRLVTLDKMSYPYYIGNYYILAGKPILITEGEAGALIGKELEIRSPAFCHADGASFCAVCVGDKIASTPDALATYAGDVGSLFLQNFLQSVHGRALKTVPYDFRARLT